MNTTRIMTDKVITKYHQPSNYNYELKYEKLLSKLIDLILRNKLFTHEIKTN